MFVFVWDIGFLVVGSRKGEFSTPISFFGAPFVRDLLWWVFALVDGRCDADVVGLVALGFWRGLGLET